MAMPACCIAFAAYWASAGAVGGVQGAGVHVAGPAFAWVEAIRAPTCTELETDTTSRMYSDISMMPNRTSASMRGQQGRLDRRGTSLVAQAAHGT